MNESQDEGVEGSRVQGVEGDKGPQIAQEVALIVGVLGDWRHPRFRLAWGWVLVLAWSLRGRPTPGGMGSDRPLGMWGLVALA
jgi:hypothetical protein